MPDKDRPSEGVFSFEDDKKWLSLRYDLTAPLARYTAKNFNNLPKPFKRYQLGTVWRNEKPGQTAKPCRSQALYRKNSLKYFRRKMKTIPNINRHKR